MTRIVLCVTLTMAWTLLSCGDDGSQPQNDAAVQQDAPAQTDSPPAQTDSAPAQTDSAVTGDGGGGDRNTGVACADAATCTGPNAQCLTEFTGLPVIGTLAFPGGYCSSDCDADGSCGPGGYCVDGTTWGMPKMCTKTCSTAADCRQAEGYECTNLFNTFPQTMCFPNLV